MILVLNIIIFWLITRITQLPRYFIAGIWNLNKKFSTPYPSFSFRNILSRFVFLFFSTLNTLSSSSPTHPIRSSLLLSTRSWSPWGSARIKEHHDDILSLTLHGISPVQQLVPPKTHPPPSLASLPHLYHPHSHHRHPVCRHPVWQSTHPCRHTPPRLSAQSRGCTSTGPSVVVGASDCSPRRTTPQTSRAPPPPHRYPNPHPYLYLPYPFRLL